MARPILVEIIGDSRSLNKALKKSEEQTSKWGKAMGAAKYAAAGLAVGGVAIATKFIEDSVHAALDAQKSQARLAVAFRNVHLQMKPYEKSIERVETASRQLGFTDEDVKNSLGSLITSTGNYKKATKEMAVAQDLARFKGIQLADATRALTMLNAGSTRAIKQLGLQTDKVTTAEDKVKEAFKKHSGAAYDAAMATAKLADKQATIQATLQLVTQRVSGQAQAYSKTASGAMEQFKAQLTHIEVALGEKLLPMLTKAILKLDEFTVAVEKDWNGIKGVVEPVMKAIQLTVKAGLEVIGAIFRTFGDALHARWLALWHDIEAILLYLVDPFKLRSTHLANAVWDGFIGGLTSGYKAVKNAITGLFGKVIGWVKDILGIASPSKVFHGIGQQVVHGFAGGVGSMTSILKKAVEKMVEHALGSVYHGIGSLLHGGPAHGSQQNRNIGQAMAAAYGWQTAPEWPSLDALWMRESGWSNTARNRTSGAYGIPQALPPTKMPFAAQAAGGSHARAQIAWGLEYIKSRYGDPLAAWAHEQSVGWYGKGGIFDKPTIIGVGEKGPEAVVPLTRTPSSQPFVVNLNLEGKTIARALIDPVRREAKLYENRNSRLAFGGA